jgi:alpha-tubulin suppressor-like RCC1 family protein
MPENDDKSTAVVFLCGDASNGKITLCDSSLFDKVIHEVASDGDNLIALCEEGCYNLSTNGIAANCNFKATNFCFGTKTNYVLTSKQPIVYSWGEGPYGELGLGFCKTKVEEPVPIKHKASFTSISSGEYHCAALDTVGNAYSWGQNFDRQLGLYRNDSSKFKSPNCVVEEVMFVPSLLPFSLLCPIRKISCGARFTVAIGRNGDLWSWGAGECGQLGTGRCTRREAPAKVEILVDTAYCLEDTQIMADSAPNTRNALQIADVACGDHHVLAVGIDGSLYGWGMNKRGQLGLGGTETKHSPTLVPSMILSTVYANGLSSAGISPAGDLFTWGSGSKYRLMQQKVEGEDRQGDDSNRYVPAYVETLYGNIVHSFAFSRKGSAALVVTRLYEVSGRTGRRCNTHRLLITHCLSTLFSPLFLCA